MRAIVGRLRNGAVVRNLGCRSIGSARWCRISARGEGGVHGWTNGRFLSESGDKGYEPEEIAEGEIRDTKCKDSPHDCLRKAENKCNGSFRTIHSESHAGGVLDDKLPGPVTWYYLEYQCGYSDGRLPKFPFRGAHYEQEYEPQEDLSYQMSTSRAINESAMRDACKSAASLAFGERSKHVLVLPVERVDNGYARLRAVSGGRSERHDLHLQVQREGRLQARPPQLRHAETSMFRPMIRAVLLIGLLSAPALARRDGPRPHRLQGRKHQRHGQEHHQGRCRP